MKKQTKETLIVLGALGITALIAIALLKRSEAKPTTTEPTPTPQAACPW